MRQGVEETRHTEGLRHLEREVFVVDDGIRERAVVAPCGFFSFAGHAVHARSLGAGVGSGNGDEADVVLEAQRLCQSDGRAPAQGDDRVRAVLREGAPCRVDDFLRYVAPRAREDRYQKIAEARSCAIGETRARSGDEQHTRTPEALDHARQSLDTALLDAVVRCVFPSFHSAKSHAVGTVVRGAAGSDKSLRASAAVATARP
jgi:hypothetical protein